MSGAEETKYGDQLTHDDDDDDDQEDDEPAHPPVAVDEHTVVAEWSPAGGQERFRAHIGHGDRPTCPFVSHVDRYHRDDARDFWAPDAVIDWGDVPAPVQERIVDAVAGVDEPAELAATDGGRDE